MKKINRADVANVNITPSSIEHFYKFIPKDKEGKKKGMGVPMVRIKGDFFGGGFNLSKNKARAIMNNLNLIKKFADGEYDNKIKELKEDEIIIPED